MVLRLLRSSAPRGWRQADAATARVAVENRVPVIVYLRNLYSWAGFGNTRGLFKSAKPRMDSIDRLKRAIGLVVATRRTAAGLSQQSLALQAGVTVAYLSRLERGMTRVISVEVLSTLAEAIEALPEEVIAEARRRIDEVEPTGSFDRPSLPRGRPRKDSNP